MWLNTSIGYLFYNMKHVKINFCINYNIESAFTIHKQTHEYMRNLSWQ